MSEGGRAELDELFIGDPPEAWRALGFLVDVDGIVALGGVRVRLGAESGAGVGISAGRCAACATTTWTAFRRAGRSRSRRVRSRTHWALWRSTTWSR